MTTRAVTTPRAVTTRGGLALLVLPFALIAAIALARSTLGPGWGLLLAVGPAVAAAVGGARYTLAAGGAALGTCLLLRADLTAGRPPGRGLAGRGGRRHRRRGPGQPGSRTTGP